jgi:hypothetical protein
MQGRGTMARKPPPLRADVDDRTRLGGVARLQAPDEFHQLDLIAGASDDWRKVARTVARPVPSQSELRR